MDSKEIKLIGEILVKHYELKGKISRGEVRAEIRNLARKMTRGGLDDRSGRLAAQIHVATGRDVVELFKGE